MGVGRTVSVAAVDEREATRFGLARWLAAADDAVVVTGSAATVGELLHGPGRVADVVLLDAGASPPTGLPADIRTLTGAGSAVVVTAAPVCGRLARTAIGNGASGLLDRSASACSAVRAIRAAADGHVLIPSGLAMALVTAPAAVELSPQEARATRLYAGGLPLGSVARTMRLSPQTVKQYIDRARAKYRGAGRPCPTKVHLYQRLVEDGLVP